MPLPTTRDARGGDGFSPLDLGEIRYRGGGLADLIEKLEPIFAQGFVVDVDSDLVEEGIDRRPQLGHGAHGGNEILFFDRAPRFGPGHLNRVGQRFLFRLAVKLCSRSAGIVPVVLLLFDAEMLVARL